MEVSKIINRKNSQISLLVVLMASLYSCGTYQSAYNNDNDGIYSSSANQNQQEVVIVENNSNFDKDYFSRQLEDLQNLNEDDTFTNIDEYYYEDEDGDIQDTVVFSDRFYRVTNKNRRLFKYYTRKSAEEEFPEYFI